MCSVLTWILESRILDSFVQETFPQIKIANIQTLNKLKFFVLFSLVGDSLPNFFAYINFS